jgi:hypothetical protein
MVAQVGYSVAERSSGRVAPCEVYTWHVETRSTGFLVEPQNQGHMAAPELPQGGQRELEPQDTWRHRSCPGWAAGAGAAGHVVAPELPRAGQRELEPQVTWRHRSCPRLGSGSWSRRTRGAIGAAPGWAAGAGAVGHVAAPELPQAGQWELEPQDTWRPRSCSGGYHQVFASLASKLVATVSPGLPSKPVAGFLG